MNETVQALRTTYKRKTIETACERPFKVIRTVLRDQDDFDVTSSDVNNVRAAMYRERRKYYVTLPHNVDETLRTLQQLILFSCVFIHFCRVIHYSVMVTMRVASWPLPIVAQKPPRASLYMLEKIISSKHASPAAVVFLPAHPRSTLCSWYRSTIHLLHS